MASKRMIRREIKRQALTAQHQAKRKELRAQINDPNVNWEEKREIRAKFAKMKRDTSKTRLSNRCQVTGRKRGYLGKFGLSRTELRRRAMLGEVPGLVKASW